MASDDQDREVVLRDELVQWVTAESTRGRAVHQERPERLLAAVVTAVVLVVVVAASITAVRLADGRSTPAVDGSSSAAVSDSASEEPPVPAETLPPGKLLARFTSEDGPDQDHTVYVGGYAIATRFVCTGEGDYSVFTAKATGESGDGGCSGGGVGAGGVNVKGSTTVRIRTDPDMTWTDTLVGIAAPERVRLRSIPDPTDSAGASVPYCTSDDFTARFTAGLDYGGTRDANAGELVFTRRTGRSCALGDHPEVRFLIGGAPLGHHTMNQIDLRRSTDHGLKASSSTLPPPRTRRSLVRRGGVRPVRGPLR